MSKASANFSVIFSVQVGSLNTRSCFAKRSFPLVRLAAGLFVLLTTFHLMLFFSVVKVKISGSGFRPCLITAFRRLLIDNTKFLRCFYLACSAVD